MVAHHLVLFFFGLIGLLHTPIQFHILGIVLIQIKLGGHIGKLFRRLGRIQVPSIAGDLGGKGQGKGLAHLHFAHFGHPNRPMRLFHLRIVDIRSSRQRDYLLRGKRAGPKSQYNHYPIRSSDFITSKRLFCREGIGERQTQWFTLSTCFRSRQT